MKTANIFSDNMVLQRDIPAPVWGWAEPGEKVTVQFKAQSKAALADASGKWMVRLDPLPASAQPEQLKITGHNGRLEFKNVVVGDVWLCSGQSNMEVSFAEIPEEAEGVDYPLIRIIGGLGKIVPLPQDMVFPYEGWQPCNTVSLKKFSRVGYYFGLELWQELRIPIGLINVSRGCSTIEAWMPPESFAANEDWQDCLAEMHAFQQTYKEYKNYTAAEKERLFLEHCRGKYGGFPGRYLVNGKPPPEKFGFFFDHMLAVRSGSLYTHAIRPIIPFGIKGVLWYQGESNLSDDQYARKQQSLIETWRELWGQGDPATGAGQAFPFYIVQVAPFNEYTDSLPGFWLEQYAAVSRTKNTGLAATVDIGDINEVHPKNKRDVGLRLALLALRDTYGRKDIIASGPTFKAMKITGGKIIVAFDNTGSGLTTKDGKAPDWFEIAGADGKFVPARAAIHGNTVEASSPGVAVPKDIRYSWSGIAVPNLLNKEGLPAWPFNSAMPFYQGK